MNIVNALTIPQYLHNKSKRVNGLYISSQKVTVIDGIKYTDEELNNVFPIHLRILKAEDLRLLKGFNKDTTKVAK
jgi:hypothetical protein